MKLLLTILATLIATGLVAGLFADTAELAEASASDPQPVEFCRGVTSGNCTKLEGCKTASGVTVLCVGDLACDKKENITNFGAACNANGIDHVCENAILRTSGACARQVEPQQVPVP